MQPEKLDLTNFLSTILSEKEQEEIDFKQKMIDFQKKEEEINLEELKSKVVEDFKVLLEKNSKVGNEKVILMQQMNSKIFEHFFIEYKDIFKKVIHRVNRTMSVDKSIEKRFFSKEFMNGSIMFLFVTIMMSLGFSLWFLCLLIGFVIYLLIRVEMISSEIRHKRLTEELTKEMGKNVFLTFPVDKININIFLLKTLGTKDLRKKLMRKLIDKGIKYPEGNTQIEKLLNMLFYYESFYNEEETRRLVKDAEENILRDIMKDNINE